MRSGGPIDFTGWVMAAEYEPGVLLKTDISHWAEAGTECEVHTGRFSGQGMPFYELANYEDATVHCQECVESLYAHRAPGFVMGALPAN